MKRNKLWFAWCLVMIFLVTSVLPSTLVYADEMNEGNKYTINASFNLSKLEPNKLLTSTVGITNNQETAESVLGIVALYDKNGTMVNVAHISKEIGGEKAEHLTAGFKLPSDVDVSTYTARVFVWDGTSIENTNGIPLSNVVELSNGTVSVDAFLSALYVDGDIIQGFDTSKEIYTVDLPEGTTVIPTVTAKAAHAKAKVEITPAAALPGTTVVKVTAEDGNTTKEYRITFNFSTSTPGTEAMQQAIKNAEALNKDDYTEDSYLILQEAVERGKALVAAPTTQNAVDAAVSDIEAAISSLKPRIATEGLQQAIAGAEALNKEGYTIDSYSSMKEAVTKGKALVAAPTTQAAVDTAVGDIQTAVNSLIGRDYIVNDTFDDMATIDDLPTGWSKVETGGTVTLVTEGSNKYLKLTQTSKTSGTSVGAVRRFDESDGKIYIEARVRQDVLGVFMGMPYVYKNGDTSTTSNIITSLGMRDTKTLNVQSQVGGATTTPIADLTAGEWMDVSLILDTATQRVKAYVNQVQLPAGTDFPARNAVSTIDLLRFYTDDVISGRPNAVGYIDNVRVYKEGAKTVNIEALEQAIEDAEALNKDDYTDDSYLTLQEAVERGKALVAAPTTQNAVDTAVSDIEAAISSLKLRIATEALEQAIAGAEALNKEDYTIDSYLILQEAAERGKALVAAPTTQNAVDTAVSDIQTARDSLKGRVYIVNNNFDGMNTINDLPAGWSKVETGGTVTLVTEGTNKYLKLEQTIKEAGKAVEAKRTFGQAGGKVYVEAKVRSDSPETFLGMPYVFKNGDTSTTDNIITSLALEDYGKINVQSTTGSGTMKTVSEFVYGQWNDVCLILDSDTQTVQAYVDEVHVGKDFPMRHEMSTVDLLRFYSDDSSTAKLMAVGYIDDVRVYREGTNTVNIEALEQAIADAEALSRENYTIDSFINMLDAVERGKIVAADPVTQDAVNLAVSDIQTVKNSLKGRDYIVNDTFDDMATIDDLPTRWSKIETGGTVTLVTEGTNKYLKLMQTSRGTGKSVEAVRRLDELSGKIYIEARIRQDALGVFMGMPFVYKNNDTSATGNIVTSLSLRDTKSINVQSQVGGAGTTKLKDLTAGEWMDVCLILDTATQKVKPYVNNVQLPEGVADFPVRNSVTTIDLLRFYSDDSVSTRPMAVGYIDNVRVYKEGN